MARPTRARQMILTREERVRGKNEIWSRIWICTGMGIDIESNGHVYCVSEASSG